MKSYRFYGDEMEALGQRLDAARSALEAAQKANKEWAVGYWRQVVQQLELRWKQLPILHDADAQVTIIPRYKIDYDFIENTHVVEGYGFTDRFFDAVFKHDADLEASWHNHRAARLARAQ